MGTLSSILAWRSLWTEEPGGPQSLESQRVGHSTQLEICLWLSHSLDSGSHNKAMWTSRNERREKEKFSGKNQGNCNLASNDFWNYRQLGRKRAGSQRIYTNANHLNPCRDYAG